MSQLTELQIHAKAARTVADLIDLAVSYGARTTPSWYVTEGGIVSLRFHFDAAPKGSEMDPWRLAIGAHYVEHTPFQHDGWHMSDTIRTTFHDMTISLSVVYPYTPVGLGAEAVAA